MGGGSRFSYCSQSTSALATPRTTADIGRSSTLGFLASWPEALALPAKTAECLQTLPYSGATSNIHLFKLSPAIKIAVLSP